MTSSNENIFRVTGPLRGEFTGPGEFPTQRPVTQSFDVFFDLCLNKRLSKQPRGRWFETTLWSLWRQCNDCLHSGNESVCTQYSLNHETLNLLSNIICNPFVKLFFHYNYNLMKNLSSCNSWPPWCYFFPWQNNTSAVSCYDFAVIINL